MTQSLSKQRPQHAHKRQMIDSSTFKSKRLKSSEFEQIKFVLLPKLKAPCSRLNSFDENWQSEQRPSWKKPRGSWLHKRTPSRRNFKLAQGSAAVCPRT